MKTSIHLTDVDLARLVDSADQEVALEAAAALARLDASTRWPSLPAHVGALVVDVLREAREHGRLIYQARRARFCRYCDARPTWKKPPRKRREREILVAGYDLADRPLFFTDSITVGACAACLDAAHAVLVAELAKFPVQLPSKLQAEGAPRYRRWDRCRCKKCDWTGHEGELGKLRTLFNDGTYPGKCPTCGVEHSPFGARPFETLDGFVLVAETTSVPTCPPE